MPSIPCGEFRLENSSPDSGKTEQDQAGLINDKPNRIVTDPDERAHFYSVVDSFRYYSLPVPSQRRVTNRNSQYRAFTHHNVTHVRRQAFYGLPQAHQQRLTSPPVCHLDFLSAVDDAIDVNAELAEAIYKNALSGLGADFVANDPFLATAGSANSGDADGKRCSSPWRGTATQTDLTKVASTIRQFYRDWSAEGAMERHSSYQPIFSDLHANLKPGASVLVPGAGLGRILLELACREYKVEGNEISYHQILAGDFAMNKMHEIGQWKLYPYATSFSNRLTKADQLAVVGVPDVLPAQQATAARAPLRNGRMRTSIGSFVDVYGKFRARKKEKFHAVVTVFFVDTAPNFLEYVETVKRVLKPDGIWCNVGPLLWHSGKGEGGESRKDGDAETSKAKGQIGSHGSVELTHEDVIELLKQYGFEIQINEQCSASDAAGYVDDKTSMLRQTYRPVHWVAKLKR